ncbi:hypothetical protein [Brasilonema sp. UFV-L1]|uniref:hypothetical protein n=1 Tax=Brasilonema sp. UFV-L1 TaxID=2234130 RepID=UPI00145C78DC|nr:hypothetical protein [Brasilonema sp. UFV-L1]NMG08700.1 hypothetical protein [Brasilonema sp. UFV-L1]
MNKLPSEAKPTLIRYLLAKKDFLQAENSLLRTAATQNEQKKEFFCVLRFVFCILPRRSNNFCQRFIAHLKLVATSDKENLLQEQPLTEQICFNNTTWILFGTDKPPSNIRLQKNLALGKSENEVQQQASRHSQAQTILKHQGTRCVECRLVALSRTGKQFTTDINNHITKQVVIGKNFIDLEKLTLFLSVFALLESILLYIFEEQRIGNSRQYYHLYPVFYDHQRRKANVSQSKWSYAELDGFIHYKVVMNNSSAMKVDPDYCSQSYSCYGHTNKHNCLKQGLTIHCNRSRGFELCADLIGGQNVAMRTLLFRQDDCHEEILVTVRPQKVSLFWGHKTIVSGSKRERRGVYRILKRKLKSLQGFETDNRVETKFLSKYTY